MDKIQTEGFLSYVKLVQPPGPRGGDYIIIESHIPNTICTEEPPAKFETFSIWFEVIRTFFRDNKEWKVVLYKGYCRTVEEHAVLVQSLIEWYHLDYYTLYLKSQTFLNQPFSHTGK